MVSIPTWLAVNEAQPDTSKDDGLAVIQRTRFFSPPSFGYEWIAGKERGIVSACQPTQIDKQQDTRSLPDNPPSRQLLPRRRAANLLLISERLGCDRLHMNGEVKKGLKCCVINLSTCTYSTSFIATTDSLLSAKLHQSGSNLGDGEGIQSQRLGCRHCGASDETTHCIPQWRLTTAMEKLKGDKKNTSQL